MTNNAQMPTLAQQVEQVQILIQAMDVVNSFAKTVQVPFEHHSKIKGTIEFIELASPQIKNQLQQLQANLIQSDKQKALIEESRAAKRAEAQARAAVDLPPVNEAYDDTCTDDGCASCEPAPAGETL